MDLSSFPELPDADVDEPSAHEALSQSSRSRFEAVYRDHSSAVLRLLRWRLGDDPDIPDLMQEAYLRILRYRDCGPESLKLLLFRTALNLATSHGLQARRRMTHVPLDGIELHADLAPMEEMLDDELRMRRLMTIVGDLPVRCRQVFLLRLIHGLRQREIAERCGISTRMVEQHLARAQVLIRERTQGLAA